MAEQIPYFEKVNDSLKYFQQEQKNNPNNEALSKLVDLVGIYSKLLTTDLQYGSIDGKHINAAESLYKIMYELAEKTLPKGTTAESLNFRKFDEYRKNRETRNGSCGPLGILGMPEPSLSGAVPNFPEKEAADLLRSIAKAYKKNPKDTQYIINSNLKEGRIKELRNDVDAFNKHSQSKGFPKQGSTQVASGTRKTSRPRLG
jgi:hypothetical protein